MKIKNHISNIGIILFACFAVMSCKKENVNNNVTSDTFKISNKEATMPVWVHGKSDANYILLAVHGGPGSDILDFRTYKGGTGFKEIENNYLVAYWQQRASGESTGSEDEALFNIPQYAEDCDKVIDELKKRYPNKKIILFGHSWGGMLTSYYLRDAARRAKVVAWIDAAGATHGQTLNQSSIDDINVEANKRIALGQNTAYWQERKQELVDFPDAANQIAYTVLEKIPEVLVKVDNSDFKIKDIGYISNVALFPEIIVTDNTPFLKDIKFPSLFLWGKYDFAVSSKQRDEAITNIGSTIKKNIVFDASGHYMMFHEPDKFAQSIIEFMKGL